MKCLYCCVELFVTSPLWVRCVTIGCKLWSCMWHLRVRLRPSPGVVVQDINISPDTLYFQTMYTHMQFVEGRNRTAPQLEYHDVAPREQEQPDHVQKFSRRILSFNNTGHHNTRFIVSVAFFYVLSSGSPRFGLSVLFERSSLFWMILQRCCRIQ